MDGIQHRDGQHACQGQCPRSRRGAPEPTILVHPFAAPPPMNIYFACSITGGRAFEAVYQALTTALLADGHVVPTAHLADSGVLQLEGVVSPAEVYERDVTWIREADALIAEVSAPSHGVGYEVGYALQAGKKVLCLARQGL